MGRVARYFEIYDDVYVEGRWHLVKPTDKNGVDVGSVLQSGRPAKVAGPIQLRHSDVTPRGNPLDYAWITGDTVPVVRARVAEILTRLAPADVELIPAFADGFQEQLFVVNVITEKRCIDDAACLYVSKYTEADSAAFSDRVGGYFRVSGLKINKSRVDNAQIFRTWGWSALIVSEEIKKAFEAAHVTGAKFVEV